MLISTRLREVIIRTTKPYRKASRRLFRAEAIQVYLIVTMKILFNPYPVFPDVHYLVFLILGLNLRYILRHLEGQVIIAAITIFSGMNTFFMWLMWLDRFSGNANFFFFQTMIFNMCFNVVFI